MRSRGAVASPRGLGVADHVCWTYGSDVAFREAAVAWLADGLAMGMKLMLTADRSVEGLLDDLAGLPDRDALVASGQLVVVPLRAVYDLDAPIDPAAQLLVYEATVEAALAEGYAGIRVVSDGTSFACDAVRRASLERWELHADRWIAGGVPLSCLCTLDARRVAPGAIADVLRVHPCGHHDAGDVAFRVSGGEAGVVVDGEVDRFDAAAFGRLLGLAPPLGGSVLDVSRLAFADHHAVLAIGEAVRTATGPVVLRGATPALLRMWELLDLPAVEWA